MNQKLMSLALLSFLTLAVNSEARAEQSMREYVNDRVTQICHAPHSFKITTSQLMGYLRNLKRKTSCAVVSITPYANPTKAKMSCVDGYCGAITNVGFISGEGSHSLGGEINFQDQQLCVVKSGNKISVAYHVDSQEKPTGTFLNKVDRFFRGWMYDENGTIFEFSDGGLDDVATYNFYDNRMNWSTGPAASSAYECGGDTN